MGVGPFSDHSGGVRLGQAWFQAGWHVSARLCLIDPTQHTSPLIGAGVGH